MQTRSMSRLSLLFMAFALILAVPTTALADEVANNIDNEVDATVETMNLTAGGANGSTKIYVAGTGGKEDTINGCNFKEGGTLELNVKSSNASVATVNPSQATIRECGETNGAAISVTPLSAGSTTISVEKRTQSTVGGNFTLSTATFTVNVSGTVKQNQTITFPQPSDKTYGDADFALGATASSNLAVSYSSSTTGVCEIVAGKVHVVSAGDCTVTATQDGNASYNSATPVSKTFAINKANLTVVTNDQTKKFGETNPELTGSITGLQYTDSITASRSTTATQNSDVGPYPITATLSDPGSKLGNYNVTNNGGTLSVTKASATISLGNLAGHTYDGTAKTASASTNPAGLSGVTLTYGGQSTAPKDAGSYAVVASLTNTNYQAQDATGTLVIGKATPQITWGAPNDITYGTQLGAAQLNASSDVAGSFSYTPASGAKLDAGDGQDLRADFTPANPGNYNTASKVVKIDVNKADQSITFGALPDKTYGDADFAVDASADSGGDVSLSSATPAKCLVTNGSASILEAGTCTIEASQGGNANFNAATSVSRSFEIAKKALAVTANDEVKTYGDPNPTFTARYSDDFVNGDTAASLGGTLGFDTDAAQGSPAGEYGITPKGLTSGNYEITFVEGSLTVGKATLTVEADDKGREYGQANPAFSASYSGFKNGDDASTLGGTLAFETNANATSAAGGDFYIRPSGLSSGNYDIVFADGTLTIAKAHAEIALSGLNHAYDSTAKAATVQITPEPAAQSATRKALTVTYDEQPAQPTAAGSYRVVASLDDDNYVAKAATATLVIDKAPLTVSADDKSRTYGDENPQFTGTLTGVKGDDGITASYSTGATASSTVGSYDIAAQLGDPNGKLSNYTVTNNSGTLTVSKAALSARADDKDREYGEANPQFTGTLTGVKNGDEVNVSYSSAADAGSEVGAYAILPAIDASEEVLANYEQPVLTDGKLTVGKAPLTIKADDATRKYDAADPTFTGSIVSGAIKNSDAVSLAFDTQASPTSNVGAYAIMPSLSGERASNYDVTAQNGTLTITKARATISLDGLSQVYDGTDKAATVTTSPDSPNKQITVTYDGSAQAPTNAGSYRVVASLDDTNYEAEDATDTLVIDKAQATISLRDLSKTYNGSPQGATVATSPASLGGVSLTYDGSAQAPTNTGSYAVVAKLDNPNYRAQDATDTLVIDKALTGVSLDRSSLSQVYDGTDKAAKATTSPAGLNVDLSYEQGGSAATPRDAGNYEVVATINDANYRGSATGILSIAKASQTINFGALGPKTLGDPDFGVNAKGGDSGNPVTFAAAGSCTISGSTVRITAIGACEITASQAGNGNYSDASPVKQSFRINYRFAGYRAPVDNGGVFNVARAGSSIPMKFGLSGNQGLNIIEAGFPKATAVNCTTSASTDAIEETTTANSGLTYDATADQYNYVWKTPSTYAGKCYKFDMVLKDGTSHTALFKFTK